MTKRTAKHLQTDSHLDSHLPRVRSACLLHECEIGNCDHDAGRFGPLYLKASRSSCADEFSPRSSERLSKSFITQKPTKGMRQTQFRSCRLKRSRNAARSHDDVCERFRLNRPATFYPTDQERRRWSERKLLFSAGERGPPSSHRDILFLFSFPCSPLALPANP